MSSSLNPTTIRLLIDEDDHLLDLVREELLQAGHKRAKNEGTAQVDSVLLLLQPKTLHSVEDSPPIQAVLRYCWRLTAKDIQ